jgi:DNA polymerase III psi subunit
MQDAMVDVTRKCMLGATPEQMHALWVQHFSAQGWAYGPQKNWETKQHPMIAPWQQLPARRQARAKLWQAIVTTMMLETPDYAALHYPSRS